VLTLCHRYSWLSSLRLHGDFSDGSRSSESHSPSLNSEIRFTICEIRATQSVALRLDFKAILYKAALDLFAAAVCRSEAGHVTFCRLNGVDNLCFFHFSAVYPELFCLSLYFVNCHICFLCQFSYKSMEYVNFGCQCP